MNKIEFHKSGKSFQEHGVDPVVMATSTRSLSKNLEILEEDLLYVINLISQKEENENEIWRVKIPYTTALIVNDWNKFFEQLIKVIKDELFISITILDILDGLKFYPYSFE